MVPVKLLPILLLAAEVAADGFLYPDASAATGFRLGDTVIVSWVSSYSHPFLQLFCGYLPMPLVNESVAGDTSFNLSLKSPVPIPQAFPNCYLQLAQGADYTPSLLFAIQKSNGSSTLWPPNGASTVTPAQTSTTAAAVNPHIPGRPAITLPTDDFGNHQKTTGGVDCWNNTADYDPDCWNVLDLDAWLALWFQKTPVCENGSTVDCNEDLPPKEAWTLTFLREAEGPGADCTTIPGNLCSYSFNPLLGMNDDSPLTTARYKYVRYSIYGVSSFFNTWYGALTGAVTQSQAIISNLIEIVDPVKKTHVQLNAILTVLGIAVSFIPIAGPELGEAVTLGTKVGDLILKGFKQAPGVAQAILPVGTEDSQDVQIDALITDTQSVFLALSINLQIALGIVQGVSQNDVNSFLAFSSNGSFTVPSKSTPSVILVQQYILQSLTTYLTSVALSSNGWHILMLPGVDPQGLSNGSAACPGWAGSACESSHDMGCTGYDDHSQCNNYWWYSASHNTAYTLNHNDDMDSTDLIKAILNKGWSTGAALFEDAAICEVQSVIRNASLPAIYTTFNGRAGFSYNGSLGNLLTNDDILTLPNGTTFLPIDGDGLSRLSKVPTVAAQLYHPNGTENGTIWQDFGPQGFDFRCTSQLNVTIVNDWASLSSRRA